MCLVEIVQHMWRTGEILQELGWTVLDLITKGTTYTRRIGLLDTLCMVVEALIDTCLRAIIQFHDVLHRFRAGKGTGTAIMELKLAQELARVDHSPLFLVLLDLRKAYNTVDRDCLFQTLEGYGAGLCLCGLLDFYGPTKNWCLDKMVITERPSQTHGE